MLSVIAVVIGTTLVIIFHFRTPLVRSPLTPNGTMPDPASDLANPIESGADGQPRSRDLSPTTGSPSSPDRPPPAPLLVEDVLRDYWGPRWDEVRPLLAERVNLSIVMPFPLPRWEEVLPHVCEKLRVRDVQIGGFRHTYLPPNPLTLAFLQQEYGAPGGVPLTDNNVLELTVKLENLSADGEVAVGEYTAILNDALARRCWRGEFDHMPVANIEEQYCPKNAIFATACGVSGWAISCGLSEADDPRLPDALRRLKEIKAQYRKVIYDYCAELAAVARSRK